MIVRHEYQRLALARRGDLRQRHVHRINLHILSLKRSMKYTIPDVFHIINRNQNWVRKKKKEYDVVDDSLEGTATTTGYREHEAVVKPISTVEHSRTRRDFGIFRPQPHLLLVFQGAQAERQAGEPGVHLVEQIPADSKSNDDARETNERLGEAKKDPPQIKDRPGSATSCRSNLTGFSEGLQTNKEASCRSRLSTPKCARRPLTTRAVGSSTNRGASNQTRVGVQSTVSIPRSS